MKHISSSTHAPKLQPQFTLFHIVFLFFILAFLVLIAKQSNAEDKFNYAAKSGEGFYVENNERFYDTQSCALNDKAMPVLSGNQTYPRQIGENCGVSMNRTCEDIYSEDDDPKQIENPFDPTDPIRILIQLLPIPTFDTGSSNLGKNSTTLKGDFVIPDVDIQFSPQYPQEGEDITATAMINNFKSNQDEVYVSWCINGTSQQGLVAGGKMTQQKRPGAPQGPDGRECCAAVTRDPVEDGDEDEDGDGLGDKWEKKYFTGIITEDKGGPNYLTQLQLVNPGDDPDGDGPEDLQYEGRKYGELLGEPFDSAKDYLRGGRLFVTPLVYKYLDPLQLPLQLAGAGFNNRRYTNLEEYVWGTNPTNPDTDGDGVKDGDDILGKGQIQFPFFAMGIKGSRTEVRATVVGKNQNKIVKIDSQAEDFYPSYGAPLEVELFSTTDRPLAGKEARVKAFVNQAKYGEQALFFQWQLVAKDINGNETTTDLCRDATAGVYCGVGKNELIYAVPAHLQPEDTVKIVAFITESFTGKGVQASLETQLSVEPMEFDIDICSDSGCTQCDVYRSSPVDGEYVRASVLPVTIPNFDLDKLAYVWKFDEQIIRNSMPDPKSLCVQANGARGRTHTIDLEVYQNGEEALSKSSRDIIIGGPEVNIGTEINARTVLAIAETRNFTPGGVMTFQWSVDGEKLNETSSRLIYTAPRSGKIKLSVVATNIIYNDKGEITLKETAMDYQIIELTDRNGVLGGITYNYFHLKFLASKYIVDPVKHIITE